MTTRIKNKEERYSRVPRLSDTKFKIIMKNKEERYSRVPRLSDTRKTRKNAIVEYLDYQIPVKQGRTL